MSTFELRGDCLFHHLQFFVGVGIDVPLCRLHVRVTKPKRHLPEIVGRLEVNHRELWCSTCGVIFFALSDGQSPAAAAAYFVRI